MYQNKTLVSLTLLGLLTAAMSTVSCTREEKSATVKIKLPELRDGTNNFTLGKSVQMGASSSASSFTGSITALTDVNCYLVTLGSPDPTDLNFRTNSCTASSTSSSGSLSNQVIYFGPYVGGKSPNSTIEFANIPYGKRTISVFGAHAQDGTCVDFHGVGPAEGAISHPRLISSKTFSVSQPDQSVDMTLVSSLTSSVPEVGNCDVKDVVPGTGGSTGGGGGGGTTTASIFGDYREGSISYLYNSTNVNMTIHGLNHGSLSYVPNNFSYAEHANTKRLSASRRITAVDASGMVLNIKVTPTQYNITSDDFQANDEVMWMVISSSATVPDDACGGGIHRGDYGFTRITSIDTTNGIVTITDPLGPSPAMLNDVTIAATTANNNVDFCRIQLVRVPSFDKINVVPGITASLTVSPLEVDPAGAGSGGIIVFRAAELSIGAGSTFTINANVAGTPGSLYRGSGLTGAYYSGSQFNYGATENAGGHNGGGGAAAGAGGNGYGGSSYGGLGINFCSGPCLIGRDHKMFFGGSGGGNASTASQPGGGIILAFIGKLSGTGTLTFSADGGDSSSSAVGGSGGGSVSLTVKELVNPNLYFSAKGGSATGGSGASGGGGGGGGSIEINYCNSTPNQSIASTLTSISAVNGGPGTSSGATPNGTNGYKLIAPTPAICAITLPPPPPAHGV